MMFSILSEYGGCEHRDHRMVPKVPTQIEYFSYLQASCVARRDRARWGGKHSLAVEHALVVQVGERAVRRPLGAEVVDEAVGGEEVEKRLRIPFGLLRGAPETTRHGEERRSPLFLLAARRIAIRKIRSSEERGVPNVQTERVPRTQVTEAADDSMMKLYLRNWFW